MDESNAGIPREVAAVDRTWAGLWPGWPRGPFCGPGFPRGAHPSECNSSPSYSISKAWHLLFFVIVKAKGTPEVPYSLEVVYSLISFCGEENEA